MLIALSAHASLVGRMPDGQELRRVGRDGRHALRDVPALQGQSFAPKSSHLYTPFSQECASQNDSCRPAADLPNADSRKPLLISGSDNP